MWNSENGLGFMSPVEVNRSYDANGNLIQKSYQGHNRSYSYDFTYDGLGRLTEIESPWESKSTYKYDALDRRVHTGRSGNHVHDYALSSMYDQRQEVG